jgi:hypothetical protein
MARAGRSADAPTRVSRKWYGTGGCGPRRMGPRADCYSVTRPFPAGMVKRRKPPFARRVQTTAIVK